MNPPASIDADFLLNLLPDCVAVSYSASGAPKGFIFVVWCAGERRELIAVEELRIAMQTWMNERISFLTRGRHHNFTLRLN